MEKFQALIFALACMLIIPWFVYSMILLWQYKEWIAITLIIAFFFVVIKLLQIFAVWQRMKIDIMLARAAKEQLMSHVIAESEVVVYILENGFIEHLSAEHERAKAFAGTRLNIKEEVSKDGPPSEDHVVREMLSIGMQVHDVAVRTRVSPADVIRIGKEAKLLSERKEIHG